jgi:hypothetical protein
MEQNQHFYKKGFNAGYIIAQHEPELYGKLRDQLTPTTEFLSGFIEGGKELEKHKTRTLITEMKSIRVNRKTREDDLDRGL